MEINGKKISKDLNNVILELKYFSKSWKTTLQFAIIGIIEIIFMLLHLKKQNKKRKEKMIAIVINLRNDLRNNNTSS
jgi:hypothetical protein